MADATGLSEALRSRVLDAAEGNPLYIEQMVALAADRPDRGEAITVPPSIESLLAARVDQLRTQEHVLVTYAAVIGREFSHEAVVALLGELADEASPAGVLRSLARKALLDAVPGEEKATRPYRFRHALIRDAAYDSLSMLTRAELHQRHADWLESLAGPVPDETVGHHLEHAFRYRSSLDPSGAGNEALGQRASSALLRAGRRAFQRDDAGVATQLLERALALPLQDESGRPAILPTLGEALANSGAYARAELVLNDAVAESRSAANEVLEANALVQLVWVHHAVGKGEMRTLLERTRDAIELLRPHDDARGLAEAHLQAAEILRGQGRAVAAERELEPALEYAKAAADDRQVARILGLVGGCKLDGPGHVDDLEAHAESCLRWARERGERWFLEVSVIWELGWVRAVHGDFEGARAYLDEARAILQQRGLLWFRAAFGTWMSEIEFLAANPKAAEEALRESYAICDGMGDTAGLCSTAAWLAHALVRQEREPLDEALRLTEISESTAVAGDVHAQVSWRTARALITVGDEPEIADRLVREATRIADDTDYATLRAHAHESLAQVLQRAGRFDDARDAARTAQRLYISKGYAVQAAGTAALCDTIQSP